MSFSKTPEQTRMNARRSRWRLSMFAWILKTKPVKVSLVGFDDRLLAADVREARRGRRRELEQRVEKRLDAEVVDRASEEDRDHARRD